MMIREEQQSDIEKIWQLNSAVFATAAEANLVNGLRKSGCVFVSLVAESGGEIVGHILFTPVELSGCDNQLKLMGLAPMAVISQQQKKGIGSKLMNAGIERCRALDYDAIVVLGHADYYPKFGFVPAVNYSIKSEYEVPDDVFMILELVADSLKDYQGIIKYHQAFNSV